MEGGLFLVLRNHISELKRMSEAVSAWCKGINISPAAEFHINLALDEMVSNIIRYGWKDGGDHQLHVHLSHLANEIRVEVEDDATPFNPLEVPAPDLDRPLDERPVGGLGIHLVRQIMDGMEYRRLDGKNLLVMKKKPAVLRSTHGSGVVLSKGGELMTLSEEKIDGLIALAVSGRIHAEASEELLKKLNDLIGQGERLLVLDFSAWNTSTALACGSS